MVQVTQDGLEVWEGTWEEIQQRAGLLDGQRLRVTLLSPPSPNGEGHNGVVALRPAVERRPNGKVIMDEMPDGSKIYSAAFGDEGVPDPRTPEDRRKAWEDFDRLISQLNLSGMVIDDSREGIYCNDWERGL